jgi:lipopolysaccharide transport system ATP-binding protein
VLAVEVESVSKRFRRQTVQPSTTLKTALVEFLLRRRRPEGDLMFQALREISFTVPQGQTLGIIGRNGSGKSTLLKLLAGIYRPDHGRIAVHGKVGALLELGAGFHPEFSGRENVLINGIVLGLSKREMRRRFDAIVRFAGLEAFIDEPVKTYSSGMYTRLGFSVAIHADPDILLIDEILAVGDEEFQHKCLDKMAELRRQGKTIVLVSHDLATVERWSDEVLWLEDGVLQEIGAPQRVIERYRHGVAALGERSTAVDVLPLAEEGRARGAAAVPGRWGSREVEIVSLAMSDAAGQERDVYRDGEAMCMTLRYKVHHSVSDPVFGIAILRRDGLCCYRSDTAIDAVAIPPLGAEGSLDVVLERLDLIDGTYDIDVCVQAKDGNPYDYHHRLYSFTVKSELRDIGVFRIPHHWVIKPIVSG